MNNIMFTEKAWEEYCYWQMQDVQCKGHYDD